MDPKARQFALAGVAMVGAVFAVVPIAWTALVTLPVLWLAARAGRPLRIGWIFTALATLTAFTQGGAATALATADEATQLLVALVAAAGTYFLFRATTRRPAAR